MDELLIEDKKYVSSKRAAKVTGYAKDYIGQLCREGRVPARLVGRSWYVLESAIQDHRFGEQKSEAEIESELITRAPAPTWEPPRYVATPTEILPAVNRLGGSVVPVAESLGKIQASAVTEEAKPDDLHSSWKAWFDKTAHSESAPPGNVEEVNKVTESETITEKGEETRPEGVNIPIHTLYELPPEDLLPRNPIIEDKSASKAPISNDFNDRNEQKNTLGQGATLIIMALGVLVATVAGILALVSTGILDKYIVAIPSIEPIVELTGLNIYTK